MNCAKCIHYVVCPYDNVMSQAELITNCIHFIDTADINPVVHGEWIWDGYYKCSNCGNRLEYNKYIDGYKFKKFCYECGAKMDGEHNEW